MSQSLTAEQLANRWQRTTLWVTRAARRGEIPGAWKLGHLWRFRLTEIEAYEIEKQAQAAKDEANIFRLAPGAEVRRRNKELRAKGLLL